MVVDGIALLHREVPVATEQGRDLSKLFLEQRTRMIVKHCAFIVQSLLIEICNLVLNFTD